MEASIKEAVLADLLRMDWLSQAEIVTIKTKDKLISVDGARLRAVIDVAKQEHGD